MGRIALSRKHGFRSCGLPPTVSSRTYVFGTSGSVLYRSDLVRKQDPFYNEANLHADMEACVVLLKTCDFGFVHQVLTYKRLRPESLGAFTEDMNTLSAGHLRNLVAHGQDYLTRVEFGGCLRRSVSEYYRFLAVSLIRGRRDKKFWDYHKRKLTEAGVGFSRWRLAGATLARLCRAVLNPYETIELRTARNISVGWLGSAMAGENLLRSASTGSNRISKWNPGRRVIRKPKESSRSGFGETDQRNRNESSWNRSG